MKATEANLLGFLKKSQQFEIPIYQRTYSWTEPECQQLFDDILRTGREENISAHFLGSIVYIEKGLFQVMDQQPLLVIDGQQRLTTITLLIEALARNIDGELIDGFSKEKLRNRYLLDPEEKDDRRYKLILTQTDESTLKAIIDQRDQPQEYSLRIHKNFEFLDKQIKRLASDDLKSLCIGISKLTIVDISLNRDHDNPQLIFESMNSTGRELSQADLIRNYILMGLQPEHQKTLYNDYWRPMEILFGQEAYSKFFDGFMRHYLTFKTGEIPNIRKVYEHFKMYAKELDVTEIIADIYRFAQYYCAMALNQEPDTNLRSAFADLRELRVDPVYPFLLELYDDYKSDKLTAKELYEVVRLIESYVFRRAACKIPTNSHNKTFTTFMRGLDKEQYLTNIKVKFLSLQSYRRFPADSEFQRKFKTHDLYNIRNRSYWLRRLENHNRKERVVINEYTIEHIMPRTLTTEWESDLGEDYSQLHEKYLHTLGNLTLTGYNAEYSNYPFIQKRDMKGGFRDSPLQINKGLGNFDKWDKSSIETRADNLAQQALSVWLYPQPFNEAIDQLKQEPEEPKDTYTIAEYPNLPNGGLAIKIFNQIRREIFLMDPCISEEVLKEYIAYKAETNFVDIIPMEGYLCLSLNLKLHELQDHKGLARDVTGLDNIGNGDVEIDLNDIADIDFVLGLVRQAFEKQMDNE